MSACRNERSECRQAIRLHFVSADAQFLYQIVDLEEIGTSNIRRKRIKTKYFRVNERIRFSPIRLIDETGKQVGVVETSKALEEAREKGLDLVEVNPKARPPICRVMDWGKFQYRLSKKIKKSPKREMKEIRLRLSTQEHDLQTKTKKIKKFLEKNHQVKITLNLRGREKGLKEMAREKLTGFIEMIEGAELIGEIEKVGRGRGFRGFEVIIKGLAKISKPKA